MCKMSLANCIRAAVAFTAVLVEAAPKPVVRERHDDAIYINVPIAASEAAALLRAPLVPDIYNGSAWASVLVDGLNHLEYHVPVVGFVDTFTSGWMNKVNLLVRNSATDTPGYLIHSIDFERGVMGQVRSTGAIVTQKIPSTVGTYNVSRSVPTGGEELHVNVDLQHGISFELSGSLLPPADTRFVDFVVNRPTKFLQMNDGTVTAATELGDGASFGTEDVRDIDLQTLQGNILEKRLGLAPLSAATAHAFFQPVYWLVDHENLRIDDVSQGVGSGVV